MIRRLLLVAAICSTTLAAESATVSKPTSADEDSVLKADSDWADAETHRDRAALERMLDDQFIATFGDDKPVDKPTFIKSILSEDPAKVVTQKLSDRSVTIAGDTAVLVEVDTQTTVKDAEKSVMIWRFTVTYIRRQGHWIALAEQGGPTRP